MLGRYGPDVLGVVILALATALYAVYLITKLYFLRIASYFVLLLCVYRMLSHNIHRRRAENDRFLSIFAPIKNRIKMELNKLRAKKDYKFLKCPGCGNTLRVPRKKGHIKITCPKCGERFSRKT
jgi:ribosomal protein S27E